NSEGPLLPGPFAVSRRPVLTECAQDVPPPPAPSNGQASRPSSLPTNTWRESSSSRCEMTPTSTSRRLRSSLRARSDRLTRRRVPAGRRGPCPRICRAAGLPRDGIGCDRPAQTRQGVHVSSRRLALAHRQSVRAMANQRAPRRADHPELLRRRSSEPPSSATVTTGASVPLTTAQAALRDALAEVGRPDVDVVTADQLQAR